MTRLGSLASSSRPAGCWVALRSKQEGPGHSERDKELYHHHPVAKSAGWRLSTPRLAVVRTTLKKDLQSTTASSVLLLKQVLEQAR